MRSRASRSGCRSPRRQCTTGPEALELGAQLVGQRGAGLHEILADATQGAQRLGVVAVGDQDTEAVMVRACKLMGVMGNRDGLGSPA
jgi:hypothetical protein